jgi:hypothetical protein
MSEIKDKLSEFKAKSDEINKLITDFINLTEKYEGVNAICRHMSKDKLSNIIIGVKVNMAVFDGIKIKDDLWRDEFGGIVISSFHESANTVIEYDVHDPLPDGIIFSYTSKNRKDDDSDNRNT